MRPIRPLISAMVAALVALLCFPTLPSYDQFCAVDLPMEARALMQFSTDRKSGRSVDGQAIHTLPKPLVELGLKLFGSREALNDLVLTSQVVNFTYANVMLTMRMVQGDNADARLGGEGGIGYGLDTLRDIQPDGIINMLDLGGNLGATVIAVLRQYSGLVRAIVVEPVPTTYFFLRWNLWLNDVVDISDGDLMASPPRSGVAVLHAGVGATEGTSLTVCALNGNSMNAFILPSHIPCECGVDAVCTEVPTATMEHLLNLFGPGNITLLKADCEGCEMAGFPALSHLPRGRIRRLVGELHMPTKSVIDVACAYDSGRFLTAMCAFSPDPNDYHRVDGADVCVRCNPPT